MRSGAKAVALTGSAIVSDILGLFLPGGSTLHQAVSTLVERRLRQSEEILMDAVSAGNIDMLKDEQLEFVVPTAFRFYQSARDGEAKHNLRILAEILAGRIKSGRLETADFLRVSRQIEGLAVSDLATLVAVSEVDKAHRGRSRGETDTRDKELIERLVPAYFENERELGSSLALLAGRGLIVPDQQTTLDASLQAYLASASAEEIIAMAKQQVLASGAGADAGL